MPKNNLEIYWGQFHDAYPNDEACEKHLAMLRWQSGFVCPKCDNQDAWYLSKRRLFDCKSCRHQTSITAGTIFHNSHVPLLKWYIIIFFITTLEEEVTISKMQRLLKIGSYKTAWRMTQKIRKVIAVRKQRFRLAGLIKINISYFCSKIMSKDYHQRKNKIVLFAISCRRDSQNDIKIRFNRIAIVKDLSEKTIKCFLKTNHRKKETTEHKQLIEKISSEGWRTFINESDDEDTMHCKIVVLNPEEIELIMKRFMQIIHTARIVILEKHRGVSKKYLPEYLSVICYRLNHRHWEKKYFDRVIKDCIES